MGNVAVVESSQKWLFHKHALSPFFLAGTWISMTVSSRPLTWYFSVPCSFSLCCLLDHFCGSYLWFSTLSFFGPHPLFYPLLLFQFSSVFRNYIWFSFKCAWSFIVLRFVHTFKLLLSILNIYGLCLFWCLQSNPAICVCSLLLKVPCFLVCLVCLCFLFCFFLLWVAHLPWNLIWGSADTQIEVLVFRGEFVFAYAGLGGTLHLVATLIPAFW